MKHIKKFNEAYDPNHPLTPIRNAVSDVFSFISDEYTTTIDYESDGLSDHIVNLLIKTKEFISKEKYNNKKYYDDFYEIKDEVGGIGKPFNLISNLTEHYKEMIALYSDIDIALERFKDIYPNSYYDIRQKDTNRTELKIQIFIEKNETE